MQGNLARQSLAVLNLYQRANNIAELIELVWSLGRALPIASRLLNMGPGRRSTGPLSARPTADGVTRRIAAALQDLDMEDALIRLAQNLPRLSGRTVIVWAPTLLDDVRLSDIRSFALYLPNPVAIPAPVPFRTPLRARIGRRIIPIQAVLGGGDIGRLAGAGINARTLGGLRQVWGMDWEPLTRTGVGSYGRIDGPTGQWTDFPYRFRVLRPPN
jgi:hypothetical protein